MGAQAMGRAREALCPRGLFVSPGGDGVAVIGKFCTECTRIVNSFNWRACYLVCAQSSALAGHAAMPTTRF
jgi:hypothetical protein